MIKESTQDMIIETTSCRGVVHLKKEQPCSGFLDYRNNCYYLGLCKLKDGAPIRDGFGYFQYDNGSLYVGQWKNEHKQGKGIFFSDKGDIYYGDWENNHRKGTGVYFWSLPNDSTSQAQLQAQAKSKFYQATIGEFNKNQVIRGVMLYNKPHSNEKPNETNSYLFIGEFNFEGEKYDKKGILYDFKRKFFYIGNFVNDVIKDLGYEIFFNEKYDVDKVITVRLREEEKNEGNLDTIWNYAIDIYSNESEKPELSHKDKELCKDRINRMFFSLVEGDKVIKQFEYLYDIIIKYKREITEDQSELEFNKINEEIQSIEAKYPEWDLLFQGMGNKDNQIEDKADDDDDEEEEEEEGHHANKDKDKDKAKHNEHDNSMNTGTGATLTID